MADSEVDLDLLATHLRNRMEREGLSVRAAAANIGCSPPTLTRLLTGHAADHVPGTKLLVQAASWVGLNLSKLQGESNGKVSTIAQVETHLRALTDLSDMDRDALVAMVTAAYDQARIVRSKPTKSRR